MDSLDKLTIQPHPANRLIKKLGIPLGNVAKYLGVSYYHASHILAGHYAPSRKIAPKLEKLYQHLLSKEKENAKR